MIAEVYTRIETNYQTLKKSTKMSQNLLGFFFLHYHDFTDVILPLLFITIILRSYFSQESNLKLFHPYFNDRNGTD